MIQVISLDAAHTLMDVNWHPGRFAFESATAFGLTLDSDRAIHAYDTLVRGRWGQYREINVTRDRTAGCFRNYPETIEALESLRAKGYQLVVVSNWDYSLERTLVALGLRSYFAHVFASLEHGVEKPERALFQIVEHQLQTDPERILHVGDNPLDDYQGARGAGWRAALLDRSLSETQRPRIPTLLHIAEALTWTD